MAYQNGTATGIADLLDKLGVFAAANGWTLNRRDANSLSISKGTIFQNLFDNSAEIRLNASTGYNAGAAWDAQPGASPYTQRSNAMSGSFAGYHFFAAETYLHIMVEVDPGLYRPILFGKLADSDDYDGGHYSAAVHATGTSFQSTLFLSTSAPFYDDAARPACSVTVDGFSGFLPFSGPAPVGGTVLRSCDFYMLGVFGSTQYHFYSDSYEIGPNTLNGIAPFSPMQMFAPRTGGGLSPMGYVHDFRLVNIQDISPGQVLTIGANEWLVFPLTEKGAAGSGNYGLAFKKIP
jgi:hypothetical protein